MTALLMADCIDADGDIEAEPVDLDVEHGQAVFTLPDGAQIVFGVEDLRRALRRPPTLREWIDGRLGLERPAPYIGCQPNHIIDRMES